MFIYDLFHSVGTWWIGGVLDPVKNVWVWDHSGTALNFTNWHPTQPNGDGHEQCAMMWDADLWQDFPCTDVFSIICERKKQQTLKREKVNTPNTPNPKNGICFFLFLIILLIHQ